MNEQFGIGKAVEEMRNGAKVQRAGWNDKNMYLMLHSTYQHNKMTLPYVYIFTADKNLVPWSCSQTDLLATDWQIVKE
jgi:uncharacterized protein DUF2829